MLEALLKQFPSLHVMALLRTPSPEFTKRYPTIDIVQGTFDDFEIIEKVASNADIVIREFLFPQYCAVFHYK